MNDNDDTCRTDDTTDANSYASALLCPDDVQVPIPAEKGPARWRAISDQAASLLATVRGELEEEGRAMGEPPVEGTKADRKAFRDRSKVIERAWDQLRRAMILCRGVTYPEQPGNTEEPA